FHVTGVQTCALPVSKGVLSVGVYGGGYQQYGWVLPYQSICSRSQNVRCNCLESLRQQKRIRNHLVRGTGVFGLYAPAKLRNENSQMYFGRTQGERSL